MYNLGIHVFVSAVSIHMSIASTTLCCQAISESPICSRKTWDAWTVGVNSEFLSCCVIVGDADTSDRRLRFSEATGSPPGSCPDHFRDRSFIKNLADDSVTFCMFFIILIVFCIIFVDFWQNDKQRRSLSLSPSNIVWKIIHPWIILHQEEEPPSRYIKISGYPPLAPDHSPISAGPADSFHFRCCAASSRTRVTFSVLRVLAR